MMTPCVRLQEVDAADGCGGYDRTWAEGEAFDALIVKQAAGEVEVAQRAGPAARYVACVARSVTLRYHEVFRRLSDGAAFRVVGGTRDSEAPGISGVAIARAECERWEMV